MARQAPACLLGEKYVFSLTLAPFDLLLLLLLHLLTHLFVRDSDLGLDREAQSGKWVLFILPLITVLREGMEAVIFVGGVSLGQPARAIPIAAIVGLVCGIIVGYLIYAFASRATLTFFMIAMTNFILLIGAGLFSRAVWSFQENAFNNLYVPFFFFLPACRLFDITWCYL